MSRIDLNSTTLTSAAYLAQDTLLELEFRGGAIYRYFNVPIETYGALLGAPSKGAYFNHYIRNRFGCAKIHRAEVGSRLGMDTE